MNAINHDNDINIGGTSVGGINTDDASVGGTGVGSIDFGDIEAALRGELSARAESLAAAPAPYAAVRQAVRRNRTRRFAGAASGLALVGTLIATLTVTLNGTSGSTVQAAAASPSVLLTIPTRGNLADDSAFIAAVKWRLDTTATNSHGAPLPTVSMGRTGGGADGYAILYANDDGVHRVVIAGSYDGRDTMFVALAGGHGAAASALTSQWGIGSQRPETFTFLGTLTADGEPVPFVVLGPTDMTNVQYAVGARLSSVRGELSLVRSQAKSVNAVDGVVAGELPGATTAAGAAQLASLTVFRARIDGRWVDADSLMRGFGPLPGNEPTAPATTAVENTVATAGRAAGLSMNSTSPGGDAVPDNVAQVFLDLADFDGVPISAIDYHVDWIGRETAQWDAALLDVRAPGLPAMQLFVRGLTAGAPDSASPGMANVFVRPAVAVSSGQLPHTASAFGGKPEPVVFGYEVLNAWSPSY